MAVSQNILGMNARNFLYIRKYNNRKAKQVADDKLLTKKRLVKNNIATPKLLSAFRSRNEIKEFDWTTLPSRGFAIKPARGYGGGGILVFTKWEGVSGRTVSGKIMSLKEIDTHLLDILDGAYSLKYLPDYAMIEERVQLHPFFKKICLKGLPDIRVIVLKSVPIMAMLRLPTERSNWTANISHGAIGIGIDIRTGITNHAFQQHAKTPRFIPETKIKVRGLKIPLWDKILLIASKTQQISNLGYSGIDIVLDAEKGPQVLEINARPGLGIQNANIASLRTRLERVENMKHVTPERGVEMAKSLFAEAFSDKVRTKPKLVGIVEQIVLEGETKIKAVEAKVDTGAFRTSLDKTLVRELGFAITGDSIYIQSASGEQYREGAHITFHLQGEKINTIASITDRSHLRYPMIIGRRDLKGFVVDPTRNSPKETSGPPDEEEIN
jgi:alpha-L-glutamate ligase-like protein